MRTVVPNPQKELTINFSMDASKKAIRDACSAKNKFKLVKDNDILNTFVVHKIWGLNDYVISISLIQISETQTKILCEVSQQLGNTHSTIIAAGYKMALDEFLDIVSKFLSGEMKIQEPSTETAKNNDIAQPLTEEQIKKRNAVRAKGITILVIIGIIFIGLMILIMK